MSKDSFHELKRKNIYFKPLSTDDAYEIHKYASDEDVSRFIGWRLMNSLNETQEYVEEMISRESQGTHLYASIALKSTQKVIGTAMVFSFDREANHAEIGYVFHKDYWGKSYGTEAVALMNDFAFSTISLRKLHARVVSGNTGSSRVLEKNGFELEGRLRDYYFIEGNYYDGLIYGKLQPWF
jgi:[ribosomal protein S5]-alanine N-acetyltransferase